MRARLLAAAAASVITAGMLAGCVAGDVNSNASSNTTADSSAAEISSPVNTNADQAVTMVGEYLKKNDPSAVLDADSFVSVETNTRKGSSDSVITDWVTGEYDSGKTVDVLVNVKSGEILTSAEWDKVESYCLDLAKNLYGADSGSVSIAVTGILPRPYFADSNVPGFGIPNMLPAGVTADEEYIKALLADGEYQLLYIIRISDEVDISIFKDTDHSALGSNVQVHVEQYKKADFDALKASDDILPEPLEIYDSSVLGN